MDEGVWDYWRDGERGVEDDGYRVGSDGGGGDVGRDGNFVSVGDVECGEFGGVFLWYCVDDGVVFIVVELGV